MQIALIQALLDNIGDILPPIIKAMIAIQDTIIENLPVIIDALLDVHEAVIEELLKEENLNKLTDAIGQIIGVLAYSMLVAVPQITAKIPQMFGQIVQSFMSHAPKMSELGDKFTNMLGEGITGALGVLLKAVSGIYDYLKDNLEKAFEKITSVGTNIIKGLWQGMENAKEWLVGKIKKLCSDALGAIKAFFGIESPSKVMANEVGKYMAEGIGLGFGKTMPSVIEAMQEKLAGVSEAMQTELAFGDIPQIQGNQIISENQYVTRNYTNTIETIRQPQTVELVLDGTKLARTLIQPLDNEYNRLGVKI